MNSMVAEKTREQWFHEAIVHIRELFAEKGHTLPEKVQISCGFPNKRATSNKNRVIGQCFQAGAAKDNVPHIFITPLEDDPIAVLDTLVHELVHAMGVQGHRSDFKAVATSVGLEGPMRGTTASEWLRERLSGIVAEIGPYPHGALDAMHGKKKQPTRLLKVWCEECGYTMRITNKWLEEQVPHCPLGCDDIYTMSVEWR